MEYPIEVPLSRPIKVDGDEYDKLVFDEMDVGAQVDFEDMLDGFEDPPTSKEQRKTTLFLIARMADVPEAVVRKVKQSDFPAIEKVLTAIMEEGKEKVGSGNGEKA